MYNVRVKLLDKEEEEVSDEGIEEEMEAAITDRNKIKQDSRLSFERSEKNR